MCKSCLLFSAVCLFFGNFPVNAKSYTICVISNVGSYVKFEGGIVKGEWTCNGRINFTGSYTKSPSWPNSTWAEKASKVKHCPVPPVPQNKQCITVEGPDVVSPAVGARVDIYADNCYKHSFHKVCSIWGNSANGTDTVTGVAPIKTDRY